MGRSGNINLVQFYDQSQRTINSLNAYITTIYSDATYQYVCTAAPDTALSDSTWLIYRVTLADGTVKQAVDANDHYGFHSAATDISVVEALTYK